VANRSPGVTLWIFACPRPRYLPQLVGQSSFSQHISLE